MMIIQLLYIENYSMKNKKGCVCETRMPPAASTKLAIFNSIKVMVKVTRSLTLESFERISLVVYACHTGI